MFCPNCGNQIRDGMAFCPVCGTRLHNPQGAGGSGTNESYEQDIYGAGAGDPGGYDADDYTVDYAEEDFDPGYDDPGSPRRKSRQNGQGRRQGAQSGGNQRRSNPGKSRKSGTGNNSTLLTIAMVVAYLLVVPTVIAAFSSLGTLFGGLFALMDRPLYSVFLILCSALVLVGSVVMIAALLLFGLRLNPRENNEEPLLLTVAAAGILRILLVLLSFVIAMIGGSITGRKVGSSLPSIPPLLLFTVAAVLILFVLLYAAGLHPFAGMDSADLMDLVQSLPEFLLGEVESLQKQAEKKSGKADNVRMNAETRDDAGPKPMNENRGVLKWYLIGIITCGIYLIYTFYTIARDINIACDGDGEQTAGLVKYFLLSLVTCGIYSFVWYYKAAGRIQSASEYYGFETKTFASMDLGPCYLVLTLGGILVSFCGIGLVMEIYAQYLFLHNVNAMSINYNERMCGVSHGNR